MTINEYLELVKSALEALPELAGIGVVVDKQQDVEKEMKQYISKSKGYCVTVGEVSNRVDPKESEGASVKLKFGVTVYSPKTVKSGEKTGSDLRDAIFPRLHLSKLQPNQHHYYEASYLDGKTFEEKENGVTRMIHAMAFETKVTYARHPDLES